MDPRSQRQQKQLRWRLQRQRSCRSRILQSAIWDPGQSCTNWATNMQCRFDCKHDNHHLNLGARMVPFNMTGHWLGTDFIVTNEMAPKPHLCTTNRTISKKWQSLNVELAHSLWTWEMAVEVSTREGDMDDSSRSRAATHNSTQQRASWVSQGCRGEGRVRREHCSDQEDDLLSLWWKWDLEDHEHLSGAVGDDKFVIRIHWIGEKKGVYLYKHKEFDDVWGLIIINTWWIHNKQ